MPDALLTELELLERGVWLAYQREKVPTYRMELQAVWETARLAVKLRRAEINPCPGENTIGDTLLRVPPT